MGEKQVLLLFDSVRFLCFWQLSFLHPWPQQLRPLVIVLLLQTWCRHLCGIYFTNNPGCSVATWLLRSSPHLNIFSERSHFIFVNATFAHWWYCLPTTVYCVCLMPRLESSASRTCLKSKRTGRRDWPSLSLQLFTGSYNQWPIDRQDQRRQRQSPPAVVFPPKRPNLLPPRAWNAGHGRWRGHLSPRPQEHQMHSLSPSE